MTRKRLFRLGALLVLALALCLGALFYWRSHRGYHDEYKKLPRHPETGVFYQLDPPGTLSADGTPWHGNLRIGDENNLIVYFFGGGIAFDDFTARNSYSVSRYDGFYFDTEDWILDYMCSSGIGDRGEDNPFRDWSVIAIPYTTGDMHIGDGEYTFTGEDGQETLVRFHGYRNYRAMMEAAIPYVGSNPEKLLIVGTSAGGFGAALLAEDVMGFFPETKDVTVCADSCFLQMEGWPRVAGDLWQAPETVRAPLHSDNILLDPLIALYKKHGDGVRILYDCSVRDAELTRFQACIDTGSAAQTNEAGEAFRRKMAAMAEIMEREIPTAGLLFWDGLPFSDDPENTLTRHTILVSGHVRDPLAGDKSALDWVWDAVQGNVWSAGLEKLTD